MTRPHVPKTCLYFKRHSRGLIPVITYDNPPRTAAVLAQADITIPHTNPAYPHTTPHTAIADLPAAFTYATTNPHRRSTTSDGQLPTPEASLYFKARGGGLIPTGNGDAAVITVHHGSPRRGRHHHPHTEPAYPHTTPHTVIADLAATFTYATTNPPQIHDDPVTGLATRHGGEPVLQGARPRLIPPATATQPVITYDHTPRTTAVLAQADITMPHTDPAGQRTTPHTVIADLPATFTYATTKPHHKRKVAG